ncbi:MAG: TolC family protein [Methylococcaceae bacterium]|nr:TolC family protein [Methylococcaceae bacterium]
MAVIPLSCPLEKLPLRLGLLLCLAVSWAYAGDETFTLEQAVEKALADNPGLAEIKARAEAMAAVPPQKAALPDPMLNFDLLNLPVRSFDLRKEDMTMMEVGISQTFPFPGKLGLQEKLAEQEALAAADSVEEGRLRLVREVRKAWWGLFFYDRALNVIDESEKFFQQLVDIAQAKYRAGQGMQQEVLLAQLELSKLKDERLELIGMRHSQTAQLNALLSQEAQALVQIPAEARFESPALSEAGLQEKARHTSPAFARHLKMLEAAQTKVDLAKRDFYPDLTVGAAYAARQNTPNGETRSDFASIRLSMNLPIYAAQKQAKAVDQRRSELLQERYSLQDEHQRIQAEIASRTAEYQHARERLNLFEHEIIPQARQTVDSLLAGYQVGRSTFSDLLRVQLSLFRYQTQYWQALVRTQQILAELSANIGGELGHE